jgi:hypothetical protein
MSVGLHFKHCLASSLFLQDLSSLGLEHFFKIGRPFSKFGYRTFSKIKTHWFWVHIQLV